MKKLSYTPRSITIKTMKPKSLRVRVLLINCEVRLIDSEMISKDGKTKETQYKTKVGNLNSIYSLVTVKNKN